MQLHETSANYYKFLGFTANPFENNTAEREPQIAAYAVRPPYLDRVLTTSPSKGIYVLTGSRGSGKSATRITVAANLFNSPPRRLVVPFISYNIFRHYKGLELPLDVFANQIAFLAIEQVLSWLAALDPPVAQAVLGQLDANEQAFVRKFVSNFYLSRPDAARAASASECFDALNITLMQKSVMWVDKKWDAIATAVATFATRLGEKKLDID